jgi:hypothetical protein
VIPAQYQVIVIGVPPATPSSSRPSQGLGQARPRQAQGHAPPPPARPRPSPGRLAQALDRPHHVMGRGRASRPRLPRPLRLPCRHHQRPHRRPRRPRRDDPLQAPQILRLANLPDRRRRVRAPFSPACFTQRLSQRCGTSVCGTLANETSPSAPASSCCSIDPSHPRAQPPLS